MCYAIYRVIVVLLRRRPDVGIDVLVVLGAMVGQHRDGCGRTGEFDRLGGLGIEESLWRRRTQG